MKFPKKITAGLALFILLSSTPAYAYNYTVKSGDNLYLISQQFNTSVQAIKTTNNLTSDTIYIGQNLVIPDTFYTVKSGDTLYLISQWYGTSINAIKAANNLTSDMIYVGQKLIIPKYQSPLKPGEGYTWSSINSYIVQSGDTAYSISKKFGTSSSLIMKYNFMDYDDWFDTGDRIAISNYAPRKYTVSPWESQYPSRTGKLVDWDLEGQYLLKRNDVFKIVDKQTGKIFNVKMMGGYNHSDVEPLTSSDTNIIKELFPSWTWSSRPVVVFKDGMNIAASFSGMPHSFDSISTNGVSGHFDLYLLNSKPHLGTSTSYVEQHQNNVYAAAK